MSEKSRKHVVITTDGSCQGNGSENSRAAAAAILNYNNTRRAVACYIGTSTNQRAEIIAAALALESLRQPCDVTLRTDSRYVVDTMNGKFKRKSNLDYHHPNFGNPARRAPIRRKGRPQH